MLLAIANDKTTRLVAWEAMRSDGPFYCPACGGEVILHKGALRAHHFAHKPDSSCRHGAGETDAHRRAKMGIFKSMSTFPNLTCALEVPLLGVRADVLISSLTSKRRYAIEVQISPLSMDEIIERTRRYAKQDIYVLWLFEWKRELLSESYTPSVKERWAHALYYGWVYYYQCDAEVCPVKFGKYLLHRPESTWYENGEKQFAGGYDVVSKRYRTPIAGKPLSLARDFHGVDRDAWTGGKIVIPSCKILVAKSL
jgi:competence protein CoiA